MRKMFLVVLAILAILVVPGCKTGAGVMTGSMTAFGHVLKGTCSLFGLPIKGLKEDVESVFGVSKGESYNAQVMASLRNWHEGETMSFGAYCYQMMPISQQGPLNYPQSPDNRGATPASFIGANGRKLPIAEWDAMTIDQKTRWLVGK